MMNHIVEDRNGKIDLTTGYDWSVSIHRKPEETALFMTAKDFEKLLIASEGDFSRFNPDTAKAISLKAAELLQAREERDKKRKESRERKRQEKHAGIMQEIRELCGDQPYFTPTSIQMAAVKKGNGFPVRTRQMYAHHLKIARYGDETVTRVSSHSTRVTFDVIYADGKRGKQEIVDRGKWGYKFI